MFKVPMQVLNYNRQKKENVSYHFSTLNLITYGCFSNGSFSELVEINEELSNTDTILCDESLNAFLNVVFATKFAWCLVVALMPVLSRPHKLNLVADS